MEAVKEVDELRQLSWQVLRGAMENEDVSNRIHTRLLKEAMAGGIIIDRVDSGNGIVRHITPGPVEMDHLSFRHLILEDDWTYVSDEDADQLRGQEAEVLNVYSPNRLTHDDISKVTTTIISFTAVLEGDPEPTHFMGRLENIGWRPAPVEAVQTVTA